MKLIHLSDLHLGKRLNEYSMIEDQKYILKEILKIIDGEDPDAILIAGDIYDKSVPSAEAVSLFDSFLVSLSKRNHPVFVSCGNHDSPERLAFGGRLIEANEIYISPVYNGTIEPVTLQDEFGEVDIYMLPFLKPVVVKSCFPEENAGITDYTSALRTAISHMELHPDRRKVLVAHQFVTGATTCESEELYVGGSENVNAEVFRDFQYTALGHIHGPQNVGSERIRYCGTPLKYSFSEAKHEKSVTVAELGEGDALTVRTVPLTPRRDLVELKGTYNDLTAKSFYENTNWQEDYVHITLTDEEDIPEAVGRLRAVYHNLMRLDYDNTRTRNSRSIDAADAEADSTPLELFASLYEKQNGRELDQEQTTYMAALIEQIWEGTK